MNEIDEKSRRMLEAELISLEEMTEEEAKEHYNVDSKTEAITYIIDYWIG